MFAHLPDSNDQDSDVSATRLIAETRLGGSSSYDILKNSKNNCAGNEITTSTNDKKKQFADPDDDDDILIREMRKKPHLCAKYRHDRYLTAEELDATNKILMSMKFIRQNSEMKTATRRIKAETVIPNVGKRLSWYRFSPRRFFYLLWSDLASGQSIAFPDQLPSSLNASSHRIYTSTTLAPTDLEYLATDDCADYQSEEGQFTTNDDDLCEEESSSHRERPSREHRRKKGCESSRFRRRKKDALAALEFFSTSPLYHPYFGFPAALGPRVRLGPRRETYVPITDDQFDDDDYSNADSKMKNEHDDNDLIEVTQENLFSPLKAKNEFQEKRKRGRPRKNEIRKVYQSLVCTLRDWVIFN